MKCCDNTDCLDALISVIVPVHNEEESITRCLDSILMQSNVKLEIIVIDDGSTDATVHKIKSLSDDRLVCIKLGENLGVAAARNVGIERARGQYIAFCDADDYWLPEKLQTQLKAMSASGCNVSHSSYWQEKDERRTLISCKRYVSLTDMLWHNHIPNLTGLYDCKILGKFTQQQLHHEDYEMWYRILKSGKSIGVEQPLAVYSIGKKTLSSNKFRGLISFYRIQRNYFSQGRFLAITHLVYHIVYSIFLRKTKPNS
jgi:glycosyltransferase involved in cell wall biosynthesis